MSTPPAWPPPPPPPTPPGVAGGPPPYTPAYAAAPAKKKVPTAAIVVIALAVVFGGVMVIGIVAAIAIPSLLRARISANETSALGTMQTVASAETAWAQAHEGRYAAAACLGTPARCGDAEAASFLPPEIAALRPRNGYEFGLLLRSDADGAPEPTASAEPAPAQASDGPTDAEVRAELETFATPDTGAPQPAAGTSTAAEPPDRGFVLWASPSNPGVTGRRRFCVDETGLVRDYSLDTPWTPPSDAQPRCPDTSTDVP